MVNINAETAVVNGIAYSFDHSSGLCSVVCSDAHADLVEVIIPDSVYYDDTRYCVTDIGNNAFNGCYRLTTISIPNSVKSIGDDAFSDCNELTSISIPNCVTNIGNRAFFGCSGLTSVSIPGSVTSIGESAFSYCSGISSIDVSKRNKVYDSRKGCNAIIDSKTNTLIFGCNKTIISGIVTSIGDLAFSGCSGLASIKIPEGVKSIGRGAFSGCSGLTSISIPGSVTSIGDFAFIDCTGLTSVSIHNSVGEINIGYGAFAGLSELPSFSIPGGLKSIDSSAFAPLVMNSGPLD